MQLCIVKPCDSCFVYFLRFQLNSYSCLFMSTNFNAQILKLMIRNYYNSQMQSINKQTNGKSATKKHFGQKIIQKYNICNKMRPLLPNSFTCLDNAQKCRAACSDCKQYEFGDLYIEMPKHNNIAQAVNCSFECSNTLSFNQQQKTNRQQYLNAIGTQKQPRISQLNLQLLHKELQFITTRLQQIELQAHFACFSLVPNQEILNKVIENSKQYLKCNRKLLQLEIGYQKIANLTQMIEKIENQIQIAELECKKYQQQLYLWSLKINTVERLLAYADLHNIKMVVQQHIGAYLYKYTHALYIQNPKYCSNTRRHQKLDCSHQNCIAMHLNSIKQSNKLEHACFGDIFAKNGCQYQQLMEFLNKYKNDRICTKIKQLWHDMENQLNKLRECNSTQVAFINKSSTSGVAFKSKQFHQLRSMRQNYKNQLLTLKVDMEILASQIDQLVAQSGLESKHLNLFKQKHMCHNTDKYRIDEHSVDMYCSFVSQKMKQYINQIQEGMIENVKHHKMEELFTVFKQHIQQITIDYIQYNNQVFECSSSQNKQYGQIIQVKLSKQISEGAIKMLSQVIKIQTNALFNIQAHQIRMRQIQYQILLLKQQLKQQGGSLSDINERKQRKQAIFSHLQQQMSEKKLSNQLNIKDRHRIKEIIIRAITNIYIRQDLIKNKTPLSQHYRNSVNPLIQCNTKYKQQKLSNGFQRQIYFKKDKLILYKDNPNFRQEIEVKRIRKIQIISQKLIWIFFERGCMSLQLIQILCQKQKMNKTKEMAHANSSGTPDRLQIDFDNNNTFRTTANIRNCLSVYWVKCFKQIYYEHGHRIEYQNTLSQQYIKYQKIQPKEYQLNKGYAQQQTIINGKDFSNTQKYSLNDHVEFPHESKTQCNDLQEEQTAIFSRLIQNDEHKDEPKNDLINHQTVVNKQNMHQNSANFIGMKCVNDLIHKKAQGQLGKCVEIQQLSTKIKSIIRNKYKKKQV